MPVQIIAMLAVELHQSKLHLKGLVLRKFWRPEFTIYRTRTIYKGL
jgi:hypothetical protein